MNTMLKLLLAASLLAVPSFGQRQDISLTEFRQSLSEFGAVVDARQGTHFAAYFQSAPERVMRGLYSKVRNPRAFRDSMQSLKPKTSSMSAGTQSSTLIRLHPEFVAGFPLFTPNYPSGSNWSSMVGTLQADGDLPAGEVSDQRCISDKEALLTTTIVIFDAVNDISSAICEIVPEVFVEILGEGTEIDGTALCFAIKLAAVAIPALTVGQDDAGCSTQDHLVDSAEIQAAYNNTVQIYNVLQQHDTDTKNAIANARNALSGQITGLSGQVSSVSTQLTTVGNNLTTLINNSTAQINTNITAETTTVDNNLATLQALQLRLEIEANLKQPGNPESLFETPQSQGGFFETARSIVQNTIQNMTTIKGFTPAITSANSQFKLGERQLSLGNYTLAYGYYQNAYVAAVAP
jgi:hypothetical protein